MANDTKTTDAKAPAAKKPPPQKAGPEATTSRGWVDDAHDEIQKAKDLGVDFTALPHDTQVVVDELLSRNEGERAKAAHELDHVKRARAFAKAQVAKLTSGNFD